MCSFAHLTRWCRLAVLLCKALGSWSIRFFLKFNLWIFLHWANHVGPCVACVRVRYSMPKEHKRWCRQCVALSWIANSQSWVNINQNCSLISHFAAPLRFGQIGCLMCWYGLGLGLSFRPMQISNLGTAAVCGAELPFSSDFHLQIIFTLQCLLYDKTQGHVWSHMLCYSWNFIVHHTTQVCSLQQCLIEWRVLIIYGTQSEHMPQNSSHVCSPLHGHSHQSHQKHRRPVSSNDVS